MFARRSDLPLDKDALSRFLPWLIAFMVFLAILAMAGMLVLNATASRWDQGIRGTLTVQVMPTEDRPRTTSACRWCCRCWRKCPRSTVTRCSPTTGC